MHPQAHGGARVEEVMTEPTKNDDVTVETLIEDVSIDGMCGVY